MSDPATPRTAGEAARDPAETVIERRYLRGCIRSAFSSPFVVVSVDALRHLLDDVKVLSASTAIEPQEQDICPSHVCAVCYHEKDRCSHCDAQPSAIERLIPQEAAHE